MNERYGYDLTPRPDTLGGGWKLRLLEDGEEVGGGVFPLPWPLDEPEHGVTWWNGVSEDVRAHWLAVAGSAVPADAWKAYLTSEAEGDAVEVGEEWLSSRPGTGE